VTNSIKFSLKLEYEFRAVSVPNDQHTIEKRKRWYTARGWEFMGSVIAPSGQVVLKFRSLRMESKE
jgi:hypothetical protein